MPRAFEGFESFEADDCLHVLDVGAGVADTVQFLAQYPCKIYFVDLNQALADDLGPGALAAALEAYEGVVFDVCLFWDLLHRLDGDQLRELNEALVSFTYSATKLHSLCRFAEDGEAVDYRIRGIDRLEVVDSTPKAYRYWSYTDFTRNFASFSIAADLHLPDGRFEMLLVTA